MRNTNKRKNRKNLKGFLKELQGAAMVEFALTIWIYLFFFTGIAEFGLITWGNAMMDNMVSQTSKRGMVGCILRESNGAVCNAGFSVDPTTLRRTIQRKTGGMVRACDASRFTFTVAPLGAGGGGNINLGNAGTVVVYRIQYDWPILFPMMRAENLFGQFTRYQTSTVVRNENFGSAGGVRSVGSGGC